jgi:hypothetical protein
MEEAKLNNIISIPELLEHNQYISYYKKNKQINQKNMSLSSLIKYSYFSQGNMVRIRDYTNIPKMIAYIKIIVDKLLDDKNMYIFLYDMIKLHNDFYNEDCKIIALELKNNNSNKENISNEYTNNIILPGITRIKNIIDYCDQINYNDKDKDDDLVNILSVVISILDIYIDLGDNLLGTIKTKYNISSAEILSSYSYKKNNMLLIRDIYIILRDYSDCLDSNIDILDMYMKDYTKKN